MYQYISAEAQPDGYDDYETFVDLKTYNSLYELLIDHKSEILGLLQDHELVRKEITNKIEPNEKAIQKEVNRKLKQLKTVKHKDNFVVVGNRTQYYHSVQPLDSIHDFEFNAKEVLYQEVDKSCYKDLLPAEAYKRYQEDVARHERAAKAAKTRAAKLAAAKKAKKIEAAKKLLQAEGELGDKT